MYSDLARKIEKARRYLEEPERVQLERLELTFHGEHNPHKVRFEGGQWSCDCTFFARHQTCSHVIALQWMLDRVLPEEARATVPQW